MIELFKRKIIKSKIAHPLLFFSILRQEPADDCGGAVKFSRRVYIGWASLAEFKDIKSSKKKKNNVAPPHVFTVSGAPCF